MTLLFRKATYADLPRIVHLLANDPLGKLRESDKNPLPSSYYAAFDAIERDINNYLMVAVADELVVAVLQITFVYHLVYQGGRRALIEGVRVDEACRGQGIGRQLLEAAINKSKEEGCNMVELTTNKKRPAALAFYQSIGFVASHEGMKMELK